MTKRAIVSVINDLVTDQRVHRTCITLQEYGYDVLLVGRRMRKSLPMPERPYSTKRMKLLFEKGVPFYTEYQFRLFWVLLFRKADLLFSNDLDTLLPNYLISKLKGKPIIYDSHEYFTGVPELMNNPTKRKIWQKLERMIVPKLRYMFTVSSSIGFLYYDTYGVSPKIIRNLPLKRELPPKKTRREMGLPEDKAIILLQGAAINVDRGAEEAIQAMQQVDNAMLLIVGGGDNIDSLKLLANKLNLSNKVTFIPKQPFESLMQYTIQADIGLTLDKDTSINYRFSLPNKLFDYIHAGLPVLASSLPLVKDIITEYKVGECVDEVTPEQIANKIKSMLADKAALATYRQNALQARETLCWDNEKKLFIATLSEING